MIEETGEVLGVFTPDDRRKLQEVHAMLAELQPYLPLLEKASHFLDNPASRFRRRKEGKNDD